MKTKRLLWVFVLALCMTTPGCIWHVHRRNNGHHYGHYHGPAVHVHGPSCGHVFVGGRWVLRAPGVRIGVPAGPGR